MNLAIISVINQKGGVGKTTTAVNLAHALTKQKKKVLVIDLDPQHNASLILGKQSPFDQPRTVIDLFEKNNIKFNDCIVPSKYSDLDFISSHIDLFYIRNKLMGQPKGIITLKTKLSKAYLSLYDFIIIDCPPDIDSVLTNNALIVSSHYLIPLGAEDFYGLKGMQQLEENITMIKEDINTNLTLLGALITMADARSNATQSMTEVYQKFFKDKIFKTIIKRNAAINSATILQKTIFGYDGRQQGAKDYIALAKEVIKKVKK